MTKLGKMGKIRLPRGSVGIAPGAGLRAGAVGFSDCVSKERGLGLRSPDHGKSARAALQRRGLCRFFGVRAPIHSEARPPVLCSAVRIPGGGVWVPLCR